MGSSELLRGEANEDDDLGDSGVARDQPDVEPGDRRSIQRATSGGGRTAALLGAIDRSRLAGACGPAGTSATRSPQPSLHRRRAHGLGFVTAATEGAG